MSFPKPFRRIHASGARLREPDATAHPGARARTAWTLVPLLALLAFAWPRPGVAALAARAAAGCAPPDRAILGEVFYDATGDDSGLEFVELYNPLVFPVPLTGLRLESGDGSGPGRWTLRWTGAAGDTVRPRARFVIGGARVAPSPDATVTLDLQNGPDAVRLAWPDGVTEVVGWGAHEFAEYHCAAPAPDVASGLSLARMPDGSDAGSNLDDFRAAAPSPGAPNQPGFDLALVAGSLGAEPEQPPAGVPFRLAVRVANAGATALAPGAADVVASAHVAGAPYPLARVTIGAAIAAGETLALALDAAALPAGRARIAARVVVAGDERASNDADSLALRVGPAPLEVTEIQFHPARGEGEWIELHAPGPEDASPDGWQLNDRTGTRGLVRGAGMRVPPRERVVLAQDRRTLLALSPGLDTTRVLAVAPWPSLNNSDDDSGIADAIELREEDGTLAARVPYSASGVPAGVPLERDADGAWRAGPDPAGTPLAPPRRLPALAGRFEVSPRRVAAGGALRLDWELPWPAGAVVVRVFDLEGRTVATAHAASRPPARGGVTWSPGPLPPGLYVLALEARGAGGEGPIAASRAIRVTGTGR